ncbi:15095_t:CDS:2, partial [Acaulospora colombiana]
GGEKNDKIKINPIKTTFHVRTLIVNVSMTCELPTSNVEENRRLPFRVI